MSESGFGPALNEKEVQFLESYGIGPKTDLQFFWREPQLFILFSVLTGGLYDVYWFYKNWSAIRIATGQKLSPVLRAVFSIFYAWPLFKIMLLQVKARGTGKSYTAGRLALLYIFLSAFTGSYTDETTHPVILVIELVFSALAAWVIVTVQQNGRDHESEEPYDEMNRAEIIIVAACTILAMLIILMSIFGDASSTTGS